MACQSISSADFPPHTQMWINAIRLSVWERSRCNEIWTGSLLGLREPRPLGWQGFEAGLPASGNSKHVPAVPGRVEGWIKARLPGDTEWRRVWAVVLRGANVPTRSGGPAAAASPPVEEKKSKRSSLLSFGSKKDKKEESAVVAVEELPGEGAYSTIAFFERKLKKGDQPICIAQHVFYGQSERVQNTCGRAKLTALFHRKQSRPSSPSPRRSLSTRRSSRSRERSSTRRTDTSTAAGASEAGLKSKGTAC